MATNKMKGENEQQSTRAHGIYQSVISNETDLEYLPSYAFNFSLTRDTRNGSQDETHKSKMQFHKSYDASRTDVTVDSRLKSRKKELDNIINASKPDKKTVRFADSRN
jgi:hypothetical protein